MSALTVVPDPFPADLLDQDGQCDGSRALGRAAAHPLLLPHCLQHAWIELAGWRRVLASRCAAAPDYIPHPDTAARVKALEAILDSEPARNFEDVRARLLWLRTREAEGAEIPIGTRAAWIDRLLQDVDAIERAAR